MPKNNCPVVILIRPQLGENIGAVARAMSNFGLSELRLVAPRDGWPNRRALETAPGGEAIIEAATPYPDIAAALSDIQLAYATTARSRYIEKRVLEPSEAMQEILAYLSPSPAGGTVREGVSGELGAIHAPPPRPSPLQGEGEVKIALVFGPERTGIENEELALCDTLVTIPTAPENSSLNLGQSVVVMGYEWFRGQALSSPSQPLPDIAPKEDWQGLFDQLGGYLDEINYYRVADKKTIMWQNLRNMLLRGQWNAQEVRTFRGMLRILWEKETKNAPK